MDKPGLMGRRAVWRRPAVLRLLLLALLAELGFAVLNISVMPVYLEKDRGFPGGVIGVVLTAFLLSEACFKTFAGHLADKHGRRLFLVLAPSLVVLTPLLTLGVPSHWGDGQTPAFIGLRVIDGLAAAMFWPAAYAAVGEAVEGGERGQAMSLLNVCFMLGLALGLPVGGGLNDIFGSRAPSFYLASGLFLATAASAYIFAPRLAPISGQEPAHAEEFHLKDLWKCARGIPFVLLLAFVVFLGVGFPMAIIKLFAERVYGLSESGFGALVLPAALAMALLGVPMGKLGERMGNTKAVRVGLLLCAAGVWIVAVGAWFAAANVFIVLAFAAVLLGVGFLLAIPAWMATVTHLNPARTGSYLGAVMTAQGFGAILGAPIGGKMYEADPFAPMVACAAALTLAFILSLAVFRDTATSAPTQTEQPPSAPADS